MNHPIYKDANINKARELFLSSVNSIGYEAASLRMAKLVGEKMGVPAVIILPSMEAMLRSHLVMGDVIKNGHVLINAEREDWASSTSARTISMIDLGHFNFPFKAGTMQLTNKEISYSYSNDKLVLCHEAEGGIFLIEVDAGRPIGEEIERIGNISADNESLIYEVLSILLYIATFYTKAKVATGTLPMNQGSKRKNIPKHKIYTVTLKQTVEGSRSGGTKKEKSEMSWIVRGHWRNQWYAKESVNKAIWMNPYWKGKGKEQVEKVYKV